MTAAVRLALFAALLAGAACTTSPSSSYDAAGDEPNRGGEIDRASEDPAVALERLRVADGYEVTLFASEQEFPIGNPVSLTFDAQGRLWVATMPAYPHLEPGAEPSDKLIILEDTDSDGKADTHTVFADSLYIPTGFELGDGGVYVAQQPNLAFLRDTDGDDRADEHYTILHGFGTGDSHHSISAFTWGPAGALYFQEGTFHRSQVETPYGVVRLDDAGVFRYEPHTEKLDVFVSYRFANPWGHVFDRWGQSFIADASNGNNYYGTALSGHVDHPRKHPEMRVFTAKVRPTSGIEFVSSRHFPDEAQGNFLVTNVIGFQGIKQHRVFEEGSGFNSEEVEPLLYSLDRNFRPVDIQFGPDGALYVVDWYNPLIGHMQYSLRDENRDHTHGRIWRITHTDKPLLEPEDLTQLSVPELLDRLRVYEDRVRYRVRRELRERDPDEVEQALDAWTADLAAPGDVHALLEALWVYQHLGLVNEPLLRQLLTVEEPRARAAAVRVLRYARDRVDNPLGLLRTLVEDEHPRVRLEAVLALSFFPSAEAAEIALRALEHPTDYYLDYVLQETIATLEPYWQPVLAAGEPFSGGNPEGVRYVLGRVETDVLTRVARSEPVYEALLRRPGVPEQHRSEALAALARQAGTSEAAVLATTLRALDAEGREGDIDALGALLLSRPAESLAAARADLLQLTTDASDPRTRAAARAAVMRADGDVAPTWEQADDSLTRLRDFVRAAALVEAPGLQEALYAKIAQLAEGDLPAGATAADGLTGRYVRLDIPGRQKMLHVAEVEVLDAEGTNRASEGTATQSSIFGGGAQGGHAPRALDGETATDAVDPLSGIHAATSVEDAPWWEVDLGQDVGIDRIVVWDRTDEPAGAPDGYTLSILDAERQPVLRLPGLSAPTPSDTLRFDQASLAGALRADAIALLPTFDDHVEESFRTLAALAEGPLAAEALAAIQQIDPARWPSDDLAALGPALAEAAARVPVIQRDSESFQDLLALGREVATRLSGTAQQDLLAAMRAADPLVVRIATVEAQMAYDVTQFEVEAGRPVLIVLVNEDVMPHNLIVGEPGSMEMLGQMGDAMAGQPDGFEKEFIPESDAVLYATPLIEAGEEARLGFTAPEDPGAYPYVCTFPGHWITMNGTMTVTDAAPL